MAFEVLTRLWRKAAPNPPTTHGRVVYAIGDVHGRDDLLERLLSIIVRDAAALSLNQTPALVFLGDYVDRGIASNAVIDRVIALMNERRFEVRALKGNHEEAMLAFMGDANFGPTWGEFGGLQTLTAYGITPPSLRLQTEEWEKAREAFSAAVPQAHLNFLTHLELMAVYGDYVFVHAGVRPGVAIDDQREQDLLWIRDDFLQARGPFGAVVVHGHTPQTEPTLGPYRIGIDTGAYATGVLTAVRLRDAEQTILQARAGDLV